MNNLMHNVDIVFTVTSMSKGIGKCTSSHINTEQEEKKAQVDNNEL